MDTYTEEVLATSPEQQWQTATLTPEEIIREQQSDSHRETILAKITQGALMRFRTNLEGILVRCVEANDQDVMPESLHARALYMAHYTVTSAHPTGTWMYTSLRRSFHWTGLALYCYTTVKQWASCARNRVLLQKHRKGLKPFPATGPLEYVAIDILGPFLKPPRGHQFILMITDRFTERSKGSACETHPSAECRTGLFTQLDIKLRTTYVAFIT